MALAADVDMALFGIWGEAPQDMGTQPDMQALVLEMKSADAPQADEAHRVDGGDGGDGALDMRGFLNGVTREMREQFEGFRRLRGAAERLLCDGDEAEQKLARADIKAATDAMSLIIRTLEKIDTLQRQFARDRQEQADRMADAGGYEDAKARFIALIEARAHAQAQRLYEAWKRDGPPTERDTGPQGRGAEPAHDTAGGTEPATPFGQGGARACMGDRGDPAEASRDDGRRAGAIPCR